VSFDPEFLDLMPHTVTFTAPTGRNAQGQPTYAGGTPQSYRCRIVGQVLARRTADSAINEPAYVLYVANGSDPLYAESKVELPNDPAWTQPAILYSVSRLTDEDGFHHSKVVCGFKFMHQEKV
jgi:hypothetical protein